MTDWQAVAVGAVIGPLLGIGLALWVDPIEWGTPARWPAGGVVAQPRATATPPAVAPTTAGRSTPVPSPRPRRPEPRIAARVEPTPTVEPTPSPTPTVPPCGEDEVRGEDGQCHEQPEERDTDCEAVAAPQDCKGKKPDEPDCEPESDDCVPGGGPAA